MEKSFGLLFFLRKLKNSPNDELNVYLKITVDRFSVEISAKRKCDPERWNRFSGRMNRKTDVARVFNAYLDTLTQKVFETKRQLIETDKPVTARDSLGEIVSKKIRARIARILERERKRMTKTKHPRKTKKMNGMGRLLRER